MLIIILLYQIYFYFIFKYNCILIYIIDFIYICFIYSIINDKYDINLGAFVQFTASGLFLKAQSSPSWMRAWFPSISVIRWIMQACYINCYHNSKYISGNIVIPGVLTTKYNIYTDILIIFGWGGKTKWYCLSMIVINFFIFRYISLFVVGYQAFIHKGTTKVIDDEH